MNHTHEYKYWHSTKHRHRIKGVLFQGKLVEDIHEHGHYHIFAQTHKHGMSGELPHTHKQKIFHPNEENIEHHAEEDTS